MWRKLLLTVLASSGLIASAQVDSTALYYANTITEEGLHTHLAILASDAYEGRETGLKGQKMAAEYIEGQFKKFGIPPVANARNMGLLPDGYQQQYPVTETKLGGLSMAVGGSALEFLKDYYYTSERLHRSLEVQEITVISPLAVGGVQLGGGGKVVLVLDPPASKKGGEPLTKVKDVATALTGTGTEVVLLVQGNASQVMGQQGRNLAAPRMRLGTAQELVERNKGQQLVVITPELAQAILDQANITMKKALKATAQKRIIIKSPLSFSYSSLDRELTGENVLGYVEGSDKKGEVIAVTAHYDHIGMQDGEVYNGADDDGSGTVAVLEMARSFAQAKADGHGPRRSILFMTVSGEEKGLLGSEWYTEHPVFPLDSTVADLNIDMIGRVDSAHIDSGAYVYVIGSGRISGELRRINEAQNATYTKLHLDYTFDSDNDPNRFYYRSDHYNFAKHGVPVAFFFNGVHADYHGPFDEVDKIRFDLLRQRAQLVFHTAWDLANREQRIISGPVEELGHD
ncbi:MAG: M28 family peptidase [Flavobacteriales bacterium]|nr:M28 family peptidase [Flavobacteriales bacterium]